MRKHALYLISLLFLGTFLIQSPLLAQKKCATTFHEHRSELKNDFELWMKNKLLEKEISRLRLNSTQEQQETILQIPVVVHIVHAGEILGINGNIPQGQILSQIDILNEDFRRMNADTVNTPAEFLPVAADIEIEFVLARRDPNGQATDGIVRVQGSQDDWNALSIADDEELKSMSYWPAEDYLNIWVTALQSNFLGYATFPVTTLPGINDPEFNRLLDGIVVDYRFFGEGFNALAFSTGRTATHEIGHYLGLRHVSGDPGFGQDGCLVDDFVDDTPLTDDQASGCPIGKITCGSTDMIENYMDFTNDVCMNLFTQEQKDRMRIVMDNSPRRTSLTTSPGLIPPVLDFDLEVVSLDNPDLIDCETSFNPSVTVRNAGTMPLSGFEVSFQADGGTILTETYNEPQPLDPGASYVMVFNQITLTEGVHDVSSSVVSVVEGDQNPTNDNVSRSSYITIDNDFIPLREEFNSDELENGWFVLNFDNNLTWEIDNSGNPGFNAKMNHFNNVFVGEENWLVSPLLDFSDALDASLLFDVSYARNGSQNDGLIIQVFSEDCNTSNSVIRYQKFGEELAVTNSILSWTPDGPEDWRRDTVDLSEFAGLSEVRVAFVAINGFGNNLYLDNIEFFTTGINDIVATDERSIKLYPNPALDEMNVVINLPEREDITIEIIDAVGHIISSVELPNSLNQTYRYDVSTLRAGVYFVRTRGRFINTTERLIKYR